MTQLSERMKNAGLSAKEQAVLERILSDISNTVFLSGAQLAEAVKTDPVMAGLVIPLEDLPDAMKKLHGGYGHIYRLYQLVRAKL